MSWINKLLKPRAAAEQGAGLVQAGAPPDVETRFDFVSILGQGGTSRVERVGDRWLTRSVARKTLSADAPAMQIPLFEQESRRLARMTHAGIPTIFDAGVNATGQPYYLQRYVEGRTLQSLIEAQFRADASDWSAWLNTVYRIALRVAETLAYAHSQGVIHADIKPANIMVGSFGEVLLIDWGIPSADGRLAMPEPGTIVGTPAYMAPEQAQGKTESVDTRTDIFLLGATLFHALCGHPPHQAARSVEAVKKAAEGQVIALLPRYRTPATDKLVCIIARCMQPVADARYADMPAVLAELQAMAHLALEFPTLRYAAGAVIVEEGSAADSVFVIQSGFCDVTQTRRGERVHLRQLKAGDVFGEAALLPQQQRTATVIAREPVEAVRIGVDQFVTDCQSRAPWLLPLMESLVRRLQQHEGGERL